MTFLPSSLIHCSPLSSLVGEGSVGYALTREDYGLPTNVRRQPGYRHFFNTG
jgi:hypothetical protein